MNRDWIHCRLPSVQWLCCHVQLIDWMATNVIQTSLLLALASVILCPTGCSDPTMQADSTPEPIILFEDVSTIDIKNDWAQIKEISISGDIVFLSVEYGGGCREHYFALFGLRYFLESNPPQAEIYLSHDANRDACKALLRRSLQFDLRPLREAYQFAYGGGRILYLRIYEPGRRELRHVPVPYVF